MASHQHHDDSLDEEDAPSFFVRALYDFESNDASSLSFRKGALIEVLTQLDSGWWDGLLDDDVRGWFPSNYVEPISDEEAEMQLAARVGPQGQFAIDANAFAGLGFGAGFDSLQALIKGQGLGASDAFGQLAEAAMLDPRRGMFGIGEAVEHDERDDNRLLSSLDKRSSRISDSSYATTSPSPHLNSASQSDISSIPPRSHSNSITDAEGGRKVAQDVSPHVSPADKERLRAQSLSTTTSRGGSTPSLAASTIGRPRAATGSQANSAEADGHHKDAPRSARRPSKKSESDFWVPKATERGEIVYYNTRTGAISHEIPEKIGSNAEDSRPSTRSSLDRYEVTPYSAAMLRNSSSGQGSSSNSKRSASDGLHATDTSTRRTSTATNGSRPSTANSNGTAVVLGGAGGLGLSRALAKNVVDNLPDSRKVPYPWKVRVTDDEKYFFFVQPNTHECRWELPAEMGRRPSARRSSSAVGINEEMDDSRGAVADSDESDIDGAITSRLPGKSPSTAGLFASKDKSDMMSLVDHPVLGPSRVAPASLLDDENAALDLQKQLAPLQPVHISVLLRHANDAIRHLATLAAEQIGTDGLSDADREASRSTEGSYAMPRLNEGTVNVVAAVRQVLYAAGSLACTTNDLSALSDLVSLLTQRSLAELGSDDAHAVNVFNSVIKALQIKDDSSLSLLKSAGVSPADNVTSTPSALHPIGRRVNATISKLVLSSRQVIDHAITLSSSPTSKKESTMTELDADVFEKLYQCRQRLREDALDLNRTLQAFGYEAERARGTALVSQNGKGWLRRIGGSLESDTGLNGIGNNSLGGGMAAGWSGSGFVLPSKYEVAALKMEAQGGYSNPFELKRDIQHALTRGKSVLKKKPTIPLTNSFVSGLEPHQAKLKGETDRLSSNASTAIDFESISASVEGALLGFGTLITFIEGVDLATSLDVDGPDAKGAKGSAINERNAANAVKAKDAVKTMSVLKQAAYDVAATLLLRAQDLTSYPADAPQRADKVDRFSETATTLSRITGVLITTLSELAKIADEQLKDASPHLGARAYVYGVDDVGVMSSPTSSVFSRRSIATSSGLHEELDTMAKITAGEDSSSDAELMYLGPGLAVPNGPRASKAAPPVQLPPQSSMPSSTHSNLLPSSRGGLSSMINRQRSTSVTTGGSNRSMQSLQDSTKQLLSRRGTLAESHAGESIDENDESRHNGKLRRLLGEDAPLSAQLTHDSESSSKRREEETPWYLLPDYSQDDIVMGADGSVKGATLGALLARLTMHDSFDSSFNNTFLMTYRSFTTTEELLDLLFTRFRVAPPEGLMEEEYIGWVEKKQKPIRLRVFNVLKSWLEMHFYEGEDDIYLDKVKQFALDEMADSPSMKTPSMQLMRLVERRQGDGEQMIRKMVLPTSAPAPILPKNMKKLKFLEIDPMEMARQLTLIESRLYNKVKPAECLGLKWTKPNNDVHAKGIMESINTHNRISAWVAEAILQQDDLKKRSALIKHFIAIADRCRALNNFSGMWAIVSALSTAPVHRLRRTWDAVSQKHVVVFESLENLMSASRNWANYRETVHKLNPPCVPFLGRYLGDLTFIEDGNRDRLKGDERLINFGKRQKTAEVIREITIHQSTPYNLSPVAAIQKFIDDNLVESRGADDLYEQSLLLEPREREDEKIARLLQESGFL